MRLPWNRHNEALISANEDLQRQVESLSDQVAVTGASGYGSIGDPELAGFRQIGGKAGGRPVPERTLERCRAMSVAGYRANPMARAIIDTYVSFCVGDSGLAISGHDPATTAAAKKFWDNPANKFALVTELLLRDHLLLGESLIEMMVAPSGLTNWSPIAPSRVIDIGLLRGNALWYDTVKIRGASGVDEIVKKVINVDQYTGFRSGEVFWWPSFQALLTDHRGMPFLSPVLDELSRYDDVLSNLVDRTALARHAALDVSVEGDQTDVDNYIKTNGRKIPPSGSSLVHNKQVEISALDLKSGSAEDTATLGAILTGTAAGAGLSKPWLAEPEDANKATSQSMAEPVRRRVGGVQNMWIGHLTEMVRFAIDQQVVAGRLPRTVTLTVDGVDMEVPSSEAVRVTGPAIAATDVEIAAKTMHFLGKAFKELVPTGLISEPAAKRGVEVAWEKLTGLPYTPDLDAADPKNVSKLAEELEKTGFDARVLTP